MADNTGVAVSSGQKLPPHVEEPEAGADVSRPNFPTVEGVRAELAAGTGLAGKKLLVANRGVRSRERASVRADRAGNCHPYLPYG